MFSLCISNRHLSKIKELNYIPVGLGNDNFSKEWVRDNTNANISEKNKYYGEYTFHYWFWKNMIDKIEKDTWIGFCGYKYFWQNNLKIPKKNFKENVLQGIPEEWEEYESIVTEPIELINYKFSKIIKNGGWSFLINPATYNKKKRDIRFNFDVFHGKGILDKAIELLDDDNRDDFRAYTRNYQSFHKWNMFICRSHKTIKNYYESIFNWLFKCENIFGFENLSGYGQTRIYGFLAERFMPYWFKKNSKVATLPIIFYDIKNDFN